MNISIDNISVGTKDLVLFCHLVWSSYQHYLIYKVSQVGTIINNLTKSNEFSTYLHAQSNLLRKNIKISLTECIHMVFCFSFASS